MVKTTLVIFDHDLTPAQIEHRTRDVLQDHRSRRTHSRHLRSTYTTIPLARSKLRSSSTPILVWGDVGPPGSSDRWRLRWASARAAVAATARNRPPSGAAEAPATRNELEGILRRKEREVASLNEIISRWGSWGTPTLVNLRYSIASVMAEAFANNKLFATLSSRVEKWQWHRHQRPRQRHGRLHTRSAAPSDRLVPFHARGDRARAASSNGARCLRPTARQLRIVEENSSPSTRISPGFSCSTRSIAWSGQ